ALQMTRSRFLKPLKTDQPGRHPHRRIRLFPNAIQTSLGVRTINPRRRQLRLVRAESDYISRVFDAAFTNFLTEQRMTRRILYLGLPVLLVLPCLSFVPAATHDRHDLKDLAQVRCQSAREVFDESWLMYKRKIQPEGAVYMFSHRLMLSELDCAETINER